MKTIEERAEDNIEKEQCISIDWNNGYLEGYHHGAIEQKQIDADIICDLMISMLNDGMIDTRDIGAVNMRIRKAMEE